jgi:hypothetical protein
MQYAKMIDLLQEAERAGSERTAWLNEAFDHWLGHQNLGEITEEEEAALRNAFIKGFTWCVHSST